MKQTTLAFLALTFSTTAFATQFDGSIPAWKNDKSKFSKPEESFQKAVKLLKEKHADKNLTDEELYRAATEGMLAALNSGKENWNKVLSPADMENMNIEISGQLAGIGATLQFDEPTKSTRVRGAIPGSPAEKSGLQPNDLILNVNGKRFVNLGEMVSEIRGPVGSTVRLKVLREDKILDFKIVRASMKLPEISAAMINETTGYLSMGSFNNNSTKEVQAELKNLEGKGLKKLIIDLRSNHGGLFEKLTEIADIFLKDGDVIVQTKSRDGSIKQIKAKSDAWRPEVKLVVLTTAETSSSAEVLAATLKENRKALILGTKTAGKWSVESVEKLPNDFYIKYSTMTLLTPSGQNLEGKGLNPDLAITTPEGESFVGYEFARQLKARLEKDSILKAAIEYPAN